jgi:hypothetical protein
LLDFSISETNSRLAGAYQSDLETVYRDELTRRLNVGVPAEKSSAWATAVALASNGIKWADPLVSALLDANGKALIDELISGIRVITISHALNTRLISLLPSSTPLNAEAYLRAHPRPGVRRPGWLKAVHQTRHGRSSGFTQIVLPGGDRVVSLGVELINYNWLRGLQSIPRPSDHWQAQISISKFLAKPCKQRLSDCLRAIAQYRWDEHSWGIPWVVGCCTAVSLDKDALLRLSDHAARGELGDAAEWQSAEGRWRQGVPVTELYDGRSMSLPLSPEIATWGFPIDAARSITFGGVTFGSLVHNVARPISEAVKFVESKMGSREAGTLATWLLLTLLPRADTTGSYKLPGEWAITLLRAAPFGVWSPDVFWLNTAYEALVSNRERFLNLAERLAGAKSTFASGPLAREALQLLVDGFISAPHRTNLLPILHAASEHSEVPEIAPVLLDPKNYSGVVRSAALCLLVTQRKWGQSPSELADFAGAETDEGSALTTQVLTMIPKSRASETDLTQFVMRLIEKTTVTRIRKDAIRVMTDLLKARRSSLTDPQVCSNLQLSNLVSSL